MDEIYLERSQGGLARVHRIKRHRVTKGLCQVAGEYLGGMPSKWSRNGGSCLLRRRSSEQPLSMFGFPEMAREKASATIMVSENKKSTITIGKPTFGVGT